MLKQKNASPPTFVKKQIKNMVVLKGVLEINVIYNEYRIAGYFLKFREFCKYSSFREN